MYKLISQIQAVKDLPGFVPNSSRKVADLKRIVVHRLGPVISGRSMTDAVSVGAEFVRTEKYTAGSYTGAKQPYHFIFKPDTKIVYQALPLTANALHAGKYNRKSIGVAILQDLRWHPLHPEAEETLSWLLAHLCKTVHIITGTMPTVKGHTELPGASSDPQKQCPGKLLDMHRTRQKVLELT